MKKLVLGLALACASVAIASPAIFLMDQAAAASSALGDLTSMHHIVTDTLALAKAGDLPAAERRITDFESAWDGAAATLRQSDAAGWTSIDHIADAAIEALRARAPTVDTVVPALNELSAALSNTAAFAVPAGAAKASFSLVNADGSPVPCEVALAELRNVLAETPPAVADKDKVETLQSKGIERCNADDDKRADNFFGEALAILKP